jgi:RNA polymerase sigma-70 factor, ECF subfamily
MSGSIQSVHPSGPVEPRRAECDVVGTGGAPGENAVAVSWDRVVDDRAREVFRLAYCLAGDAEDAARLTHAVFVEVFRRAVGGMKASEHWPHRVTAELFLACSPGPRSAHPSGMTRVQAALESLAPRVRSAVVLHDVAGLSTEEIATTLHLDRDSVQRCIYDGRVQLRHRLSDRPESLPEVLSVGGLVR